jgi:hypothetical protein
VLSLTKKDMPSSQIKDMFRPKVLKMDISMTKKFMFMPFLSYTQRSHREAQGD